MPFRAADEISQQSGALWKPFVYFLHEAPCWKSPVSAGTYLLGIYVTSSALRHGKEWVIERARNARRILGEDFFAG
jgi:hypothetical protein